MSANPETVSRAIEGRLRVRHLALFAVAAEVLTMRGAAARMNLTQSAVSKSMQELEDIVGVALFSRHRRGLSLTDAGRSLLGRAGVLLREVEKIGADLAAVAAGATGRVGVGVLPAAETDLLPSTLLALADHHPGIIVALEDGTREALVEGLEAGRLDCVVGRLDVRDRSRGLVAHALYDASIAIVCAPHHPLLRAGRVELSDLAAQTWILPSAGAPIREAVERHFAAASLPAPKVRVESTSVLTNVVLVQSTSCVAAMATGAAGMLARAGQVGLVPVVLDFTLPPVGVLSRAVPLPAPTAAFIATLRRQAQTLGCG